VIDPHRRPVPIEVWLMNTKRLVRIAALGAVAIALSAGAAWLSVQGEGGRTGADGAGTGLALAPGVTIGGDFNLVDHTGQPVTSASYDGRLRLMFFGFTYCPDICPTELQMVAAALDQLGADAQKVAPLFVSIDPARDQPPQMAEYVGLFHPAIVGLTGTEAQVAAAARNFRVYYAKVPGDDPEFYTMDHSTYTYLMGPKGEFLTVFARGTTPEQMARTIRQYL